MTDVDHGILLATARLTGRVPVIDPTSQSPDEMRRLAEASASLWSDGMPAVADVYDEKIMTAAGVVLRARCMMPARTKPTGAILFMHGGGWTIGSVDTHDRVMRCLASETGVPVIGIDYRLAPEHPFPAALHDTQSALRWLTDQAAGMDIDVSRIALAGDSSGANLALAAALAERDSQDWLPAALALFYGCFAPRFDTNSHRVCGGGQFGLTTQRMRLYWANYLRGTNGQAPALAAPLNMPLDRLPPVYLAVAELDPLADDSRDLARRLREASIPYKIDAWPGAVHGFLQMSRDVELARRAISSAAAFLRPHLD
jgi:acetyl esterase